MNAKPKHTDNEEGFVLVTALLIMLVLTIIGIAANRNTSTELQIAGNDRTHKQTFYEADGGTEFAAEVLEQNIACIDFDDTAPGTTSVVTPGPGPAGSIVLDNSIAVSGSSLRLWQNGIGTWAGAGSSYPADDARDMWFPPEYQPGEPHTNITVEGTSELNTGGSIIMAAGYLGLGRSIGSGGVKLEYEIFSQRVGRNNSESVIRVEWRHVVGMEDPHCRYN